MGFTRILDLGEPRRSTLLLGPRQTGKTWLARRSFPDAPYYNLLRSETFLRLATRPAALREELVALKPRGPILIDEIQKLPILLDEIQAMIDELGYRFILTGSSARKLRRSGANLLGGRALVRRLHPLVSAETGELGLGEALNRGRLPPIWLSEDPWDELRSYCGTYLQEEIAAEGVSRRIDAFARFLRTAAHMNGELLNFEAFGSDASVPARTVREYYAILGDTLVGDLIEPWGRGTRRKAVSTGRFWFFDIGVRNALAGEREVVQGTERWGRNLEHFVYLELRAFLDYRRDERPLTFWRTRDGREVDFILGDEIAIEVKATSSPTGRHLGGLEAIAEEGAFRRRILVCQVERPSRIGGLEVLPLKGFLDELWSGAI